MKEQTERIMIYVTGATYEGRQKILKKLYLKYTLGEKIIVKLKREPDNKFDKYAIKVLFNKKHVGYVPKKISKYITESIKSGILKKTQLYDLHTVGEIYGASIMLKF